MKRRATVSRRSLLKALGPFVACLPIANLLRTSISEAGPQVAPLRLILVYAPYHAVEQYWHPQAPGGGLATSGSNFTLDFPNSILAPLAPYQSQLIIFRGLNRTDYINHAVQGHQTGATTFTGAKCTYPDVTSKGTSIEQYLSSRMAPPGALAPMLAGAFNSNEDIPISWVNGVPQDNIGDALTLFNSYFGNFQAPNPMMSGPSPKLLRRTAIMNYSQSGLKDLLGRLSGPEAQKLDQHLSSLASLQSQLSGTLPTSASCAPPTSAVEDQGWDGAWAYDPEKLAPDFAAMTTLISQAFACDITRFASFMLADPDNVNDEAAFFAKIQQMPANMAKTFNGGSNTWHGFTHGTSDTSSPEDLAEAYFENFQMTQIANLMNALKAISDPLSPGQTLLDNTVILFMGEHGICTPATSNAHGGYDSRSFIAGGCGGMFKGGRVLEATPRIADSDNGAYAGVSHNGLLTAIVNAFETNQAKYNPSFVPKILTGYGDYPATPLVL